LVGILRRLHQQGPRFETVIDIGASNGMWTKIALERFPQHRYLLLEAQPVHAEALREFAAAHKNVEIAMAAAGATRGEIHFDASDPFGGQASDTPYPANNIVVPVTTLDREVASRSLPGPFLIKFDTHGFEPPILKGATQVLQQASVIIMECYNFKISPDCLLFPEMCVHMQSLGFRCVDMADVMHRKHDGALWQMDLVFVRADRPEFSHHSYL
jgi:FkbM family methyltransferase